MNIIKYKILNSITSIHITYQAFTAPRHLLRDFDEKRRASVAQVSRHLVRLPQPCFYPWLEVDLEN